jgi:hypothetical protein
MSDRWSSRYRSRSRSPGARRRSRSRSFEGHHRSLHAHEHSASRRSSYPPRSSSSYTRPLREELYVFKYVALDEYMADCKASKYALLPYHTKLRMFGSGTMPIFVPLAYGETPEQYETRFRDWLRRQHFTLAQVQGDEDIYKERRLRIEFANKNVTNKERFEAFDWSRVEEDETARDPLKETEWKDDMMAARREGEEMPATSSCICREEAISSTGAVGGAKHCPSKHPVLLSGQPADAVVEAHLACGCTPCLFVLMDRMVQHLDAIQAPQATTQGVVDPTEDGMDAPSSTTME